MKVTVTVRGLDVLERKLRRLVAVSRGPAIAPDVVASARPLVASAQARAPVRSGRLRASLRVMETTSSAGGAQARVGTDVPYAARIEFGFAGRDSLGRLYSQPAQPYLRPAADDAGGAATRELAARMRRRLLDVSR